jgi:uncharacterized protein YecT (DUF1311 family)
MKRPWLVTLGLLLAAVEASPAAALDCAKAVQPVEKMLCSTDELKKADDEMIAAYVKLLRETKDPDFHAALLQSQRRWLEQRLLDPQRFSEEKADDGEVLLKVTRDRLAFLTSGQPIRVMEAECKAASKDSGGPRHSSGANHDWAHSHARMSATGVARSNEHDETGVSTASSLSAWAAASTLGSWAKAQLTAPRRAAGRPGART